MSSFKKKGGNKKRSNKNKQNQNKNKNQQGGADGNSYSVAASNGGVPPMVNYRNGGSLVENAAPFTATIPVIPVTAGNGFMRGGNVPVAPVPVPVASTSVPVVPVVPGGSGAPIVPVPMNGANVVTTTYGGGNPLISNTGGNVLNNLAVPAVLLYANQTFGKKKNYTGKNRKFRNNRNRSRRYRRAK